MSVLQSIILGIVQGLTEFLPISSSAHLRVVPALLGWEDPGVAFSAIIQLGSVVAVLAYFWKDLLDIACGSAAALRKREFDDQHVRLAGAILIGTLPVCVLGLMFKHIIEEPGGPFRSLIVIGSASIFMGLLLGLAEKVAKHGRGLSGIGARDGLLVGFGQAMALIPGCSRSGSTLTVAMLLNMKRDDAARFSFLLGIPAIVLSGLLELKESLPHIHGADWMDMGIGLLVSLVVSYAAIAWLLKYLRQHSTWVFVGYRLLFGSLVLVLALNNRIH